jgi:hypothetical protein
MNLYVGEFELEGDSWGIEKEFVMICGPLMSLEWSEILWKIALVDSGFEMTDGVYEFHQNHSRKFRKNSKSYSMNWERLWVELKGNE